MWRKEKIKKIRNFLTILQNLDSTFNDFLYNSTGSWEIIENKKVEAQRFYAGIEKIIRKRSSTAKGIPYGSRWITLPDVINFYLDNVRNDFDPVLEDLSSIRVAFEGSKSILNETIGKLESKITFEDLCVYFSPLYWSWLLIQGIIFLYRNVIKPTIVWLIKIVIEVIIKKIIHI